MILLLIIIFAWIVYTLQSLHGIEELDSVTFENFQIFLEVTTIGFINTFPDFAKKNQIENNIICVTPWCHCRSS